MEHELGLDVLVDEGLVIAVEAARSLGLRVSVWTILRWVRHGARRRQLEAVKVGGRWFTSVAALRRFLEAGSVRPVAPRRRSEASPATERYLQAIGLGRSAKA